MAIKKVFFSTIPSCIYTFKNGKAAPFINHQYHTSAEWEIDELTAEVNAGHQTFYIDENKKEIDTAIVDPLEFVKQKAIADYLAAQAAATDPTNDRGTVETTKLNPQVTAKLVAAATSNTTPSK